MQTYVLLLLAAVAIISVAFPLLTKWLTWRALRSLANQAEEDFQRRLERSRERKIVIAVHQTDEQRKEA